MTMPTRNERIRVVAGIIRDLWPNRMGIDAAGVIDNYYTEILADSPVSFSLRDRDGDWWVYNPITGGWHLIGSEDRTAYVGHPEEQALRIIERFGVWA